MVDRLQVAAAVMRFVVDEVELAAGDLLRQSDTGQAGLVRDPARHATARGLRIARPPIHPIRAGIGAGRLGVDIDPGIARRAGIVAPVGYEVAHLRGLRRQPLLLEQGLLRPLVARAGDGIVACRGAGDEFDRAGGGLGTVHRLVDGDTDARRIGVDLRVQAGSDQSVDDRDLAGAGVHAGRGAGIDAVGDEVEPRLVVHADIAEATIDLDVAERVRADDLAVQQHRTATRGRVDVGHDEAVVDDVVGDRHGVRRRPAAAEDAGETDRSGAVAEPVLAIAAQDVADIPADRALPIGDPAGLDRGVDIDRGRLDRDLGAVDLGAAAGGGRVALPVDLAVGDDHEADIVAHVIAAGAGIAGIADIADAVAIELHRKVAPRALVLLAVEEIVQVGRALAVGERIGNRKDRLVDIERVARSAAGIVDGACVFRLGRRAGIVHTVRPVRGDHDRAVRDGRVELERVDALAGEAEGPLRVVERDHAGEVGDIA